MANQKLLKWARDWEPKKDDVLGDDKKRLISFLLDNGVTSSNPMSIKVVMAKSGIKGYSKESFQHSILGPLRRERNVFIGTSNSGIFLITSPADADTTLGFYTWRVRAELRHARSLRALAKRVKLHDGYESTIPVKKDRAVIYLDESGTPDIADLSQRSFVVGAVVINSRQEFAKIERRFQNAFAVIGRREEHELKTNGLSVHKHALVLHELTLLDYQWAAACFDKARLATDGGFQDPKTFYRYAFQFLIGELLTTAWQADLVIDAASSPAFQHQFETYLRRQNSGLPIGRLQQVNFADSSKHRLVQLADLVAGAVRRSVEGDSEPLDEIEHQAISLQFWPPR